MKKGTFPLNLKQFDEHLRLLGALRLTDVFGHISDRVLIGHLYDDVFPSEDTLDDVDALLKLQTWSGTFRHLQDADKRKQFIHFLVRAIPIIGNDGYRPYLHMPTD